ncbi:hypothetical protein ACFY2R_16690 [Micromonospora olivasterospora]|uniref:IPT/TIG domain-containing protein n=1 Tax=Micromonospora olivasterospora TaxID=1880 RepID=A0A562IFR3_MICOL|nr:hypothetical protein [Micromonospora olivasterospora]TWH69859.1 hypothetical protein JD77_04874 [Micromonospora olivasterospora]
MRLSRIIMALTIGLAVVSAPTAAGAAQPQPAPTQTVTDPPQPPPYPPQAPRLRVVPTTIFLGETVRVVGTGFGPRETIDVDIARSPLAAGLPGESRRGDGSTVAMAPVAYQAAAPLHFTVRTDGNGDFSREYRPSTTGRLTFTATGRTTDRTASATLTVLRVAQPAPTRPGGLPVTGDSLGTPLAIGGGLVGAGVVLTLAGLLWRRRGRFGVGPTH